MILTREHLIRDETMVTSRPLIACEGLQRISENNTLSAELYKFAQLMEQIEENEGVIDDKMLPVLHQNEVAIAQKVDSYVNFSYVVKGQAEQLKVTIDKFKKQLTTLENLYTHLKSNVKNMMEAYDLLKIEGNDRAIKLVKNGGVQSTQKPSDMFHNLEIVDEKYVVELSDYLITKIVHVVRDKDEFKQAVADGKFESISLLPRGKYVKFI